MRLELIAAALLAGSAALDPPGWPAVRPPTRLVRIVGDWRRRRLERRAESLLPAACAELAAHVRAGRSLAQSVGDAAEDVAEPMGSRLRGAAAAIALGAAPADALSTLGSSDDVRLLTGAVALQGRSGGDLSALLDGMANLLLERRDARRAAEVATAQARATARMVIALPGAGLLALLVLDRPALGALLASPIGWLSLLGSAGLCLLGRSLIGRLGTVRP